MITTSDPAIIGKRIRELRRQKEMTQEELGNYIGVTRATINKYEAGQVNFPRDRIDLLSRALGVSPSYLLGWLNPDVEACDSDSTDPRKQLFSPNVEVACKAHVPDYYKNAQVSMKRLNETHHVDIQEKIPMDPMLRELERIYNKLSMRDRNILLTRAYELEDGADKCEQ